MQRLLEEQEQHWQKNPEYLAVTLNYLAKVRPKNGTSKRVAQVEQKTKQNKGEQSEKTKKSEKRQQKLIKKYDLRA